MRWLKAKFAICAACDNLIRAHETLSRGEDRIFRPKTPAMRQTWWTIAGHFLNYWPIQNYVKDRGNSPPCKNGPTMAMHIDEP